LIGKGDNKTGDFIFCKKKIKEKGEGNENGEAIILPCWYMVGRVKNERCISLSIFP